MWEQNIWAGMFLWHAVSIFTNFIEKICIFRTKYLVPKQIHHLLCRSNEVRFRQQEQTLVMTSLFDEDDDAVEMTWIDDSHAAHISRLTVSKQDTVLAPNDTFSLLLVFHTPSTHTTKPLLTLETYKYRRCATSLFSRNGLRQPACLQPGQSPPKREGRERGGNWRSLVPQHLTCSALQPLFLWRRIPTARSIICFQIIVFTRTVTDKIAQCLAYRHTVAKAVEYLLHMVGLKADKRNWYHLINLNKICGK